MLEQIMLTFLKNYNSQHINDDGFFIMSKHYEDVYNNHFKAFVDYFDKILNNEDYFETNLFILNNTPKAIYILYFLIYGNKDEENENDLSLENIQKIDKKKRLSLIKDNAEFSTTVQDTFEANINKQRLYLYFDEIEDFKISYFDHYKDNLFELFFDEAMLLLNKFFSHISYHFQENSSDELKELSLLNYKI